MDSSALFTCAFRHATGSVVVNGAEVKASSSSSGKDGASSSSHPISKKTYLQCGSVVAIVVDTSPEASVSWYLDGCLVGALIRPNARKALESALATSSLRMAVGKEMFGTLRVVTLPCFGPLPPPDDDDDEGTADTDDDDPSEEKLEFS